MSEMKNHGTFLEFTRSPEERNTADYRKRVRELEHRVSTLEKELSRLYNLVTESLEGGKS